MADDSCRTGVHRPYALPEYGSAHHSADRRGAAAPPWVAIWGVTASISRPPALGCTHLARWQDGGFRVGLHDKSTRVKGVHTPTRSTWVAVCIATLPLPGCWVAPNAHVQPKGEPRLIEEGVEVQSVKDTAVIREIDATTRTIVVSPTGGGATESYRAGAQVSKVILGDLREMRFGPTSSFPICGRHAAAYDISARTRQIHGSAMHHPIPADIGKCHFSRSGLVHRGLVKARDVKAGRAREGK